MAKTRINNRWINHEDDVFFWFSSGLSLPLESYKDDLLTLNLEIHKLTYKYEFLMPLSNEYCDYHSIDKFEHYKNFLIENQHSPEIFQTKNYLLYKNNINQISNMYFRNIEGELVNKNVHYLINGYYGNPVAVESKLEYTEDDPIKKYGYDDCPLRVCLRELTKVKDKVNVSFVIESYCSIWLDQTPNFKHMDENGKVTFFEYSDNRDIAFKNTPRLNSFLRDLKELIKSYGGRSSLYNYQDRIYQSDISVSESNRAIERNGLSLEGKVIFQEDLIKGDFQ